MRIVARGSISYIPVNSTSVIVPELGSEIKGQNRFWRPRGGISNRCAITRTAERTARFFSPTFQPQSIVDDLAVAPEAFQVVIGAGFLGKDVHEVVAVVHQHPLGVIVTFDAERTLAGFL